MRNEESNHKEDDVEGTEMNEKQRVRESRDFYREITNEKTPCSFLRASLWGRMLVEKGRIEWLMDDPETVHEKAVVYKAAEKVSSRVLFSKVIAQHSSEYSTHRGAKRRVRTGN